MYCIPMDRMPSLDNSGENRSEVGKPAIYEGTFSLEKTGDTFIDMRGWGKGIVFVNGINLGRYWGIGPQQTLYLPGCWLRKGENRIAVFEQLNENPHESISTIENPILDQCVSRSL
jgi:beta-galactosidase